LKFSFLSSEELLFSLFLIVSVSGEFVCLLACFIGDLRNGDVSKLSYLAHWSLICVWCAFHRVSMFYPKFSFLSFFFFFFWLKIVYFELLFPVPRQFFVSV
jgi:hypothetical protein